MYVIYHENPSEWKTKPTGGKGGGLLAVGSQKKKDRRRIKRIVGYDSAHHTHTDTHAHMRERRGIDSIY